MTGPDEEDEWAVFTNCQNCGNEITNEEYARTGVDEYCDSCPEMCCDPRSVAFGDCECEEGIGR
jgi:hypothetical protein